jgi:hypothetical protein
VQHQLTPLQSLVELGAARVQHIHADLASHLWSTSDRLREWGNDEPLCLAGLFHAVYGTFGFDEKLVELKDRPLVAEIIGKEAEAMVYLYGACNRALTYPQICRSEEPVFHDRFSMEIHVPSIQERRSFAELTVANEIDVAAPNLEDYLAKFGQYVLTLFHSPRFRRLLSQSARRECVRYFGN